METISIANLPKGTKRGLEKQALAAGYKKVNGSPNLSAYIRTLFQTAIANSR